MISCTEFILCYNEIFNFLCEHHGKQAVIDLWTSISDNFLRELSKLVEKKGIQGMKEYWNRTLKEEGADYNIDTSQDTFILEINRCPSVAILSSSPHVKKYHDYCDHCDVLYRRVVEKYGFDYQIEYIDRDKGACKITIRRKDSK